MAGIKSKIYQRIKHPLQLVKVGLLYETPDPTFQGCGGSIVGTQYVLTAAHCTNIDKDKLFVDIGDTILASPFENPSGIFSIKKIINHPGWDPDTSFANDISVLKLAQEIPLDSFPNIKPVCLPSQGEKFSGIG